MGSVATTKHRQRANKIPMGAGIAEYRTARGAVESGVRSLSGDLKILLRRAVARLRWGQRAVYTRPRGTGCTAHGAP